MPTLFVAGHSDSGGRYLVDEAQSWTSCTRAWLEQATDEPWVLHMQKFAAMGPAAADYLLGAVDRVQPDIVILPLGAYVCTVGVVSESVRVRFGERAHRLYLRTETEFQAKTSEGQVRRVANRAARRTVRTVLGTRTLATLQGTGDIYEEILHGLARVESLQVVAVADARFSEAVQAREPRLQRRFDALNARLRPVAEQHHFAWADLEAALREAPDRRVFHHDDGVHTTAAFHAVYFQVLQGALAGALRQRSEGR